MLENLTVKVVIPALNEARSIREVLEDIPEWVDGVIVSDNGSTDGTGDLAAAAGATVVREMRRGYGRACLAALRAIDFCDVVVFLDGDYSDYPHQMDRLLAPIARDEADMVIGVRTPAQGEGAALTLPQRFGTALACHLIRMIWGFTYADLGPFRAIRWSSLKCLKMGDPTYGWTVEMQVKALLAGLRVAEAPVDYRRRIGDSKVSGTLRGVVGAGIKIPGTIARFALSPPRVRGGAADRLILFTRYPDPYRTKTRLIPALGALGAAELQRRMTLRTLATARALGTRRKLDIEVSYTGASWRQMRRWLGTGVRYTAQCKGGLGARLAGAFEKAFEAGSGRVVIVGTDAPGCDASQLPEALEALKTHDLALGPTTDGGYWLIGLRRPADIFTGIRWGTDSVLRATLRRASSCALSTFLLDPIRDVDRPEDLALLDPSLHPAPPYISVIIPTRNEAGNIEAAIRSARTDGVEIIVVDGESSDGTPRKAGALGVSVLTCAPGRAGQMNLGARNAKGEVLLFLHADTTLPPRFERSVFRALLDPLVVGGAHLLRTNMRGVGIALVDYLVRIRTRYRRLPYGDQGIFVRKSAFDALGGFPEVAIAEDLLFMRRLRRLGRVVSVPATVTTSGRRWQRAGLLRGLVINQIVAAASCLSLPPRLMMSLRRARRYRRPAPRKGNVSVHSAQESCTSSSAR